MVHVPALTSVTVLPETMQTAGVCEKKLTGSPELAVALTVKGLEASGRSESGGEEPKLMNCRFCVAGNTTKLSVTGGAAAYTLLPICTAVSVHVPAEMVVRFSPETV